MIVLYDLLLEIIFIVIGVYFIFSTYKKPATFYSTNIKGYLAGLLFLILGLLSLCGKYSLFEIFKNWLK